MATEGFKINGTAAIGTSFVAVYTAPLGFTSVVIGFDICNITGSSVDVDIEIYDSSLALTYNIAMAKTIVAGDDPYSFVANGHKLVLESGDEIRVKSNTLASVDVVISSLENTDIIGSSANLDNDSFLTGRNFANNASIGLIKIDTSDDTVLNADVGNDIIISPNATTLWRFLSGGELVPDALNGNPDIGDGALDATHIDSVFAHTLERTTAGGLSVAALDNINLSTNSILRLILDSSDNLKFDNSFNISANTSNGADDLTLSLSAGGTDSSARGGYVKLYGNENATPGAVDIVGGDTGTANVNISATSSAGSVLVKTQNTIRWTINAAGELITAAANKILTSATSQSLTLCGGPGNVPTSDGAVLFLYGASAYGGGAAILQSKADLYLVATDAGSNIVFETANVARWTINPTGHLVPYIDATYEIGSALAHVSGIYVSTLANLLGDLNFTTATGNKWSIGSATGDLIFKSATGKIVANTSDGADNKYFSICGGGSDSQTRGGVIIVQGNEAGNPGNITFLAGNVTGANFLFQRGAAVDLLKLNTGANDGFQYTPNGNFFQIYGTTSDAADNKAITISGGGAASDSTRGAYIRIFGNEFSTNEGVLELVGGNTSTGAAGKITLKTTNANSVIEIQSNSTARWQFDGSGNFAPVTSGLTVGKTTSANTHINEIFARTITRSSGDSGNLIVQCNSALNSLTLTPSSGATLTALNGVTINADLSALALTGGTNVTLSSGTGSASVTGAANAFLIATTGDINIQTTAAANITFVTNNTQRWVINSAGHIVPIASATYDLGTTGARLRDIYTTNAVNVSDRRLKTDINTIDSTEALEKVIGLNPVQYKFINNFDPRAKQKAGFIAQEVADIIPEAVWEGDHSNVEFGEEGFESWSLQTDHIIPYLVAAIKRLEERVRELEE